VPVTAASQPPVGKTRGWKPQSLATKDGCLYPKNLNSRKRRAVIVQLFATDTFQFPSKRDCVKTSPR
jgi:hypothetical protein